MRPADRPIPAAPATPAGERTGSTQPLPPLKTGARGNSNGGAATTAPRPRGGVTLSLPVAIAIIILFLLMGGVLVLMASGLLPSLTSPATPTITHSPQPSATFTLAPTATPTSPPSPTPLPPVEYTVKSGDTCISIAVLNNIGLQALLDVNGLSQACPLTVGQKLIIPQPTYTPTAQPTNTLEPEALTETARPRTTYTVAANDTLFSIAARYGVDLQALADENGIPGPDYPITVGQVLTIPLDKPVPTPGPSPTATPLPPYAAPILLNPPNGMAVSAVEQTVILQWSAVDILKEGEVYLVTVEDLTCNCAKIKRDVTTATRYIVDVSLKPAEAMPHVFKWSVVTARKVGETYEAAGATSEERTFTWTGIGAPPNPTQSP
jgi:LysM repeat protein